MGCGASKEPAETMWIPNPGDNDAGDGGSHLKHTASIKSTASLRSIVSVTEVDDNDAPSSLPASPFSTGSMTSTGSLTAKAPNTSAYYPPLPRSLSYISSIIIRTFGSKLAFTSPCFTQRVDYIVCAACVCAAGMVGMCAELPARISDAHAPVLTLV